MRTTAPWLLFRIAVCIFLLLAAGNISAQSAADQALKTLPQTVKDNGENHVVTKTNTASAHAMNKIDSAGGKVIKGFTGMFKKKNKKKSGGDSTAAHPTDTTAAPKHTSYNRHQSPRDCLLYAGVRARAYGLFYDPPKYYGLFKNSIFC